MGEGRGGEDEKVEDEEGDEGNGKRETGAPSDAVTHSKL